MSRSLHTQKLAVRAHRRLVRPYSKRREECGYLSGRKRDETIVSPLTVPIKVQKPLRGTMHPLTPRELRAFLAFLGPALRYGLKTICLRQDCALRNEGIVFAEYVVPGEIHLYSIPESPWRLPFLLHAEDRMAFENYGAQIERNLEREQTTVHWSADGLMRFALHEVVAHELGHHLLQHHKGKRKLTVCRRTDHERRAELQSHRVKKLMKTGADCL
jgi:hypothetical protein